MDKKGKSITITSAGIQTKLMATVQIHYKGKLGFGIMEMGAHSLSSGAEVAMYLSGVSPLTMMMIQRWISDAFLLYLWKKLACFSTTVSFFWSGLQGPKAYSLWGGVVPSPSIG